MTCIRVAKISILSALAALPALGFSTANAADFGRGESYGGAAIPVPAPVPIPEIIDSQYYIRFDTGGTFDTSGDLDNIGSYYELKADSDLSTSVFGSVGIGKYISRSIRAEVSFTVHDDYHLAGKDAQHYHEQLDAVGPDFFDGVNTYPTIDRNHYNVTRTEDLKFAQSYGLVSLYYDIHTGTAFTPYVGAGVGVSWRQLKRRYSETAVCDYTENSDYTYPPDACQPNPDLPDNYNVSGTINTTRWDIAAALMAGFAYEFTDGIHWDTGYRYLWQNGSMSVSAPTITGDSTIVFDSIEQHQVVTGLRFDIN